MTGQEIDELIESTHELATAETRRAPRPADEPEVETEHRRRRRAAVVEQRHR